VRLFTCTLVVAWIEGFPVLVKVCLAVLEPPVQRFSTGSKGSCGVGLVVLVHRCAHVLPVVDRCCIDFGQTVRSIIIVAAIIAGVALGLYCREIFVDFAVVRTVVSV